MGTDIDREKPTAAWLRASRAGQTMDDGAGGQKPWTVEELVTRMAAEVGWAPQRPNYSKYENGRAVPSPATLARFVKFWARYDVEPPNLNPASVVASGESTPPDVAAYLSRIDSLVEQLAADRALIRDLLAMLTPRPADGRLAEAAAEVGAAEEAAARERAQTTSPLRSSDPRRPEARRRGTREGEIA
jgi:transcriptional regulator with XRE-family HTH domain